MFGFLFFKFVCEKVALRGKGRRAGRLSSWGWKFSVFVSLEKLRVVCVGLAGGSLSCGKGFAVIV